VDEGKRDPAFDAFRAELLAAVRRRDLETVWQKLHDRLRTPAQRYAMDVDAVRQPATPTDTWSQLERVLTLGGSFITEQQHLYGRGAELGANEFCAPYIYSAFPHNPDGLGEAEAGVLLQRNVAVHAAPSAQSSIVTRRSHEVVKFQAKHYEERGKPSDWTRIETLDGKRGYVRSVEVRNVTDYHACFGKFEEGWLMTEFAFGNYP